MVSTLINKHPVQASATCHEYKSLPYSSITTDGKIDQQPYNTYLTPQLHGDDSEAGHINASVPRKKQRR